MRRLCYAGCLVLMLLAATTALRTFTVSTQNLREADLMTWPSNERHKALCAAPLRQALDTPSASYRPQRGLKPEEPILSNLQPTCEEVGRSRLTTSGAVLVAAGLALALGRRTREPSPAPVVGRRVTS
jgi:hypothetical protein